MSKENFLPDDYNVPSESNYSKIQQGQNKFRILSSPVIGWEDWKDNKPVRYHMPDKPDHSFNPEKPIRHFWAMPVWDYQKSKITILEITQKSIMEPLKNLSKDPDWGSPVNYDININKKGEGLMTEYSLTPAPPKPINGEIKLAFDNMSINLDALFDGGDPFKSPF